MRQVKGAFAPCQSGTCDDHFAFRLFPTDMQVLDREHACTIGNGERRLLSFGPYCNDGGVGGELLGKRCINGRVQTNVHSCTPAQQLVGAPQLVHLALKGKRLLQAQNATKLVARLAQRHPMPALSCSIGSHHAGDTAADHEHAFALEGRCNAHALDLAPDERVHGAAARLGHGSLGHADEAAQALHHLVAAV